MSADFSYSLYKIVHVFGVVLWIAGIVTVHRMLGALAHLDARVRTAPLVIARKAALFMDIGATFAIVGGLLLALQTAVNQFTNGPWLHIKLTLVVVGVLFPHILLRKKLKQMSNGADVEVPAWILALTILAMAGAATLGIAHTLLLPAA